MSAYKNGKKVHLIFKDENSIDASRSHMMFLISKRKTIKLRQTSRVQLQKTNAQKCVNTILFNLQLMYISRGAAR